MVVSNAQCLVGLKVVTKPIDREDAIDKEVVVKLDRCRIDMIHPRLHPTLLPNLILDFKTLSILLPHHTTLPSLHTLYTTSQQ